MSLPPSVAKNASRGVWSEDEHERFREALELYPMGPWKAVAEFIGTRTVRQVQTHAQKYHEKAARRLRDLRLTRERRVVPAPLIDYEMKEICEGLQRHRVPLSPRSAEMQLRSVEPSTEAPWVQIPSLDPLTSPPFDECMDFLIDALESSASESGSP